MTTLLALDGLLDGLKHLVTRAPSGPARKITQGLFLLFTRALGGQELAFSLTSVVLTAILLAILTLAMGIFALVNLKSEEMRAFRGVRQEAAAGTQKGKGGTGGRQRKSG
jgi:hypothetical protein